jgi:hypothetical protein
VAVLNWVTRNLRDSSYRATRITRLGSDA